MSVIAGMTYRSYQEIELCRTAFLIAWRALLREKRLTAKNMETLPGQLMTAVMLASMTADGNAERVAEAAWSGPSSASGRRCRAERPGKHAMSTR